MTTDEEFILGNLIDTIEDKERYRILHGLSGTIHNSNKRVKYSVVFARKKGKLNPVVILDNGEILVVRDRYIDLCNQILAYNETEDKESVPQPEYSEAKLIPQWERYIYFVYKDTVYKFGIPVFWNDNHNINTINNDVITYTINKKVFTKDIFDEGTGIIKTYYYHDFPSEYDVMMSFVILTYTYEELGRVFYLPFYGGFSSGKSVALKLLSYLSRNGFFNGKGTVASSVRLIAHHSISLFQDEFEKMNNDEKLTFTNVMNSGFNKGGVYTFTNMGVKDVKNQVVSLKSFCPKSFTCNSLWGFDVSFLNRCYIIHSVVSGVPTKDIHQLNDTDLILFQDMRNKLFTYCMNNWNEILKDINDTKKELEQEKCFGRESDILGIILGIITHFKGKDYSDKVKTYIKNKAPLDLVEKSITMEEIILTALVEDYETCKEPIIDIENTHLHLILCQKLGFEDTKQDNAPSNKKPKQILDDLGLVPNRENLGLLHGRRHFYISVQNLLGVLTKKGYMELAERIKPFTIPILPPLPILPILPELGREGGEGAKGRVGKPSGFERYKKSKATTNDDGEVTIEV